MKRLNKTRSEGRRSYFNFLCTCGSIVERRSDNKAESCGCLQEGKRLSNRELPKGSPFTLLEPVVDQKHKVRVLCRCGHKFTACPTVLFKKSTKSCLKCQNIVPDFKGIGGVRNHPAYGILDGMKRRCYVKSHASYKYYGAVGVTVCDEWKNSYTSFCLWADSSGYHKGLTIDRKDVDYGYNPDNCRWVPMTDQRENKHMQVNNTSGYVGVSYVERLSKYESYYSYNKVKYSCGFFTDPKEAYDARILELDKKNIKYNRQGKISG